MRSYPVARSASLESERMGPGGLRKAGKEQEPAPGLEPNNFAALQILAVWVREPGLNNFEVPQRPGVQVQVPERNSFAALQKPAARGLTEPAENKKAQRGQVRESAPERKPEDD
jgi:hypothetical protein